MTRTMGRPYRDPLDEIWLRAAARLGWTVRRAVDVYASWDGVCTLTLSTEGDFDPDDCLAQMILHEICHALVEAGRGGLSRVDWGLENVDDRDLVREHACHRLQAALTGPWGLREALAPTTTHRPYYDALPPDPLGQSPRVDPAVSPAREAWHRAQTAPWREVVQAALQATAEVAAVLARFQPESLLSLARPPHPTGLPPGADPLRTCGTCGWFQATGGRCSQSGTGSAADAQGCLHWERPLVPADCVRCGACCRQGFDAVDVEPGSILLHHRADWVSDLGFGPQLVRPDGFCPALTRAPPYRCAVYNHRPEGCRDLEVGGDACREARRRVGLHAEAAAQGAPP